MTNEERKVFELALDWIQKQPEETPHSKYDLDTRYVVLRELEAALAQPEQEPVEWGVDWGKDGNSVSIIKRLADGNIEVLAWEYAPHPPQRTWVGLTEEDWDDIFGDAMTIGETIKVTEAKLKEKNT